MVYPSLNHFVFGSAIIVMAEAPVPSLSDNESQGSFDGMAVLDVVGCQLDDSSVIQKAEKQRECTDTDAGCIQFGS